MSNDYVVLYTETIEKKGGLGINFTLKCWFSILKPFC